MNPVAQLRGINAPEGRYEAIVLWCPGCAQPYADATEDEHHSGLHMLPVSGAAKTQWTFDGNLELPTLSPSILTRSDHKRRRINGETVDAGPFVCHSFLVAGVWQFLGDCTHPLVNQHVPVVPLPDWVVRE